MSFINFFMGLLDYIVNYFSKTSVKEGIVIAVVGILLIRLVDYLIKQVLSLMKLALRYVRYIKNFFQRKFHDIKRRLSGSITLKEYIELRKTPKHKLTWWQKRRFERANKQYANINIELAKEIAELNITDLIKQQEILPQYQVPNLYHLKNLFQNDQK